MTDLPTIYLVRHGETEWSKSGKHTGRTDLPLTTAGEEDARRVGKRLQQYSFNQVFSSPLMRARRTAELAGFHPSLEDDLLEWNYGEFDGHTSAEIRKQAPHWNLFRDGCPGGESPAEVEARVDRFISRLLTLNGLVICFAHGHILRVLGARWVRQPLNLAAGLLLNTASLSILSFDHHDVNSPALMMWNSGTVS